jgi:hypothetical protein
VMPVGRTRAGRGDDADGYRRAAGQRDDGERGDTSAHATTKQFTHVPNLSACQRLVRATVAPQRGLLSNTSFNNGISAGIS